MRLAIDVFGMLSIEQNAIELVIQAQILALVGYCRRLTQLTKKGDSLQSFFGVSAVNLVFDSIHIELR